MTNLLMKGVILTLCLGVAEMGTAQVKDNTEQPNFQKTQQSPQTTDTIPGRNNRRTSTPVNKQWNKNQQMMPSDSLPPDSILQNQRTTNLREDTVPLRNDSSMKNHAWSDTSNTSMRNRRSKWNDTSRSKWNTNKKRHHQWNKSNHKRKNYKSHPMQRQDTSMRRNNESMKNNKSMENNAMKSNMNNNPRLKPTDTTGNMPPKE